MMMMILMTQNVKMDFQMALEPSV